MYFGTILWVTGEEWGTGGEKLSRTDNGIVGTPFRLFDSFCVVHFCFSFGRVWTCMGARGGARGVILRGVSVGSGKETRKE